LSLGFLAPLELALVLGYYPSVVAPSVFRLAFVAGAILLLVAILLPGMLRAQGWFGLNRPGDHTGALVQPGLKRTFLVHVPPIRETKTARASARPMVIVLHGGGGTGPRVARLTGLSELADREGFIVVYPNAINNHWNDGRNVNRFRSQRENIDDVGFLSRLIDRFVKQLNVDSTRVYVTGISNGGMMCHRVGCDLSQRIAAIAPVSAGLPVDLPDSCPAGLPVSVLAINGTDDPLVPYEGGGVGLLAKRGAVLSVDRTIDFWVRRNQCAPEPKIAELPDRDPNDGISVVRREYANGREGSAVILYTVRGGGHTWPGGSERPERFGRRSDDFNASEVIWRFFQSHRRM
jgi:polyhydroxybutyrate depolymerase